MTKSKTSKRPFALADARERVIRENIVISLGVILVLIVSALVGKIGLTVGVIGHEGSTVIVVLNGLRLLRVVVVSEKMTGKLLERFSGRKTMDSPLEGLSDRELEVFQLIGQGKTMKEIGDELHISPKTVEVHRARIREKLKVTSAAELISYAARWTETQA